MTNHIKEIARNVGAGLFIAVAADASISYAMLKADKEMYGERVAYNASQRVMTNLSSWQLGARTAAAVYSELNKPTEYVFLGAR